MAAPGPSARPACCALPPALAGAFPCAPCPLSHPQRPQPCAHATPSPPRAAPLQVSVRKQTLQDLYELHRKVNPKEVLIGWYSTWMGGRAGGAAGGGGSGAAAAHQQHPASAAAAEHRVDDEFTVVVHEFFSDVAGPGMRPQGLIHLLVDVSLVTPHINVFAYRPISNALLKQCVCLPVQCSAARSPRLLLPLFLTPPPSLLPLSLFAGCPW